MLKMTDADKSVSMFRRDLYRHKLSHVVLLRGYLTLICVNRARVLRSAVVSRSSFTGRHVQK